MKLAGSEVGQDRPLFLIAEDTGDESGGVEAAGASSRIPVAG